MYSVKIISDISCPWCIVGYRALINAVHDSGLKSDVDILWKPFELNPLMPPEGQDRVHYIRQKYHLNADQALANRQHIIDRGLAVNYEFSFVEGGRVYNTFDAHRLIHWAAKFSLQTELKLAFFDLYFKYGGNPSDQVDLLRCVKLVGLDVEQARAILCSDEFALEVREDEQSNLQNGITSIPSFIFNDQYLVTGGQPKEVFVNIFKELGSQR